MVLTVDVVALHGDFVAGLPVADGGTDAEHDTGGVGANNMLVTLVALGPIGLASETIEEAEGGHWFKDRGPHGVEVDARRHNGDVHLVGGQVRSAYFVDVQ